MSVYRRLSVASLFLALALICGMCVTACGSPAASTSSTSTGKPLQNVSIGLGYTPDIQFAPFYVAESKGYYKDAGLNVTLNHGVVTDLIGTMFAGKNTFVFASGDELMSAYNENKSLQALDVSTVFQQYPVSIIVPKDSSIKQLSDLKGHTIGVPGLYGATYTGMLALLQAGHLTQSDVKIQSIGYNQVSALMTHKEDAVVGYSNNEPLQLERDGFQVRTFNVSNYLPLVSNGIITTKETYTKQAQVVKSFVQATLEGVKYVDANPSEAVSISAAYVPGMNTSVALDVLKATIPVYEGSGKLGYNDPAAWQSTEKFLVSEKLISPISNLSQLYTNS